MSLKELTKDIHKEAENTRFSKYLLSTQITPELYRFYLLVQYDCYSQLEKDLYCLGFPHELQGVFRSCRIQLDIIQLSDLISKPSFEYKGIYYKDVSKDYVDYIIDLGKKWEYERLLAHLYVRHFGDMYGGQIIRNVVPGRGFMYDFSNVDFLKSEIRSMLTDDMAEEARTCFKYIINQHNTIMDIREND